MTFHEKLARLTEDRVKTVLSRRAGLPVNAISDYVNKTFLPRCDTALRIARVLGVSVEWLVDDAADWPPVRVTATAPVESFTLPVELEHSSSPRKRAKVA